MAANKNNKKTFNKRILFLMEQANTLLSMPRSHVRNLGNAFDTIASHSHHVSIIAYCIARMEKLTHEEGMKALTIGAFHDLAEGRMADLDFISKHYTKDNEELAIKDQFKDIEFGPDLEKLLGEYKIRESLVTKCAKDADQIAQMFHEWTLMWRGNNLAQQWFEGGFKTRLPYLYTKSAKEIALSMKDSNPNEWWWSELLKRGGKPKIPGNLVGKIKVKKKGKKNRKKN